MVNSCTNINKTNNCTVTSPHLTSPQIIEHTKDHDIFSYGVGNSVPGLEHAQKCDGVKLANVIPTLPLGSPTLIRI
jgi:hypothetical protein